jgi:hypothetical protein
MNRLLLSLFALPTLVGSSFCWLSAIPAYAKQQVSGPNPTATEAQLCIMSAHSRFNLVCEKISTLKDAPKVEPVDYATDPHHSPAEFKFSEEESDAAIALFGCDCPLCLNSLRMLRTMPQAMS